MSAVPVLTTDRLVLREHREDDLADYAALWSDHEVVRFITGKPLDRAECWTRILRFAACGRSSATVSGSSSTGKAAR